MTIYRRFSGRGRASVERVPPQSGASASAPARLPDGCRIYAIGDVHGRADLLAAKFTTIDQHIAAHPIARPIIVLLGDYVDRGPQSRQVLDLILQRRETGEVVALAGNHDALFLNFIHDPRTYSDWAPLGGFETLMSYGVAPLRSGDPEAIMALGERFRAAAPAGHIAFLERLRLTFSCGGFLFVHAGIRPNVPFSQQKATDLMWIRDEFLEYEGDFGTLVVHGHSRVMQPDIRPNRINIDTGAYATNRLTCLMIEQDRISFL